MVDVNTNANVAQSNSEGFESARKMALDGLRKQENGAKTSRLGEQTTAAAIMALVVKFGALGISLASYFKLPSGETKTEQATKIVKLILGEKKEYEKDKTLDEIAEIKHRNAREAMVKRALETASILSAAGVVYEDFSPKGFTVSAELLCDGRTRYTGKHERILLDGGPVLVARERESDGKEVSATITASVSQLKTAFAAQAGAKKTRTPVKPPATETAIADPEKIVATVKAYCALIQNDPSATDEADVTILEMLRDTVLATLNDVAKAGKRLQKTA